MAGPTHRIAVIPGDGIGKEVVPEGMRVLEAAGRRFGFGFAWTEFDWSCEAYTRTGRMMPEDGLERLRPFEGIFLGAVGAPGVPDHISLWGLLIPIRRTFRQYVNLRPVRLLRGVRSPLAGRTPDDVDMVILRENNEGEYSEIGGRLYKGTDEELAIQQAIFTRKGVERVVRYSFDLCRRRARRKRLTMIDKANAIGAMDLWTRCFEEVGRDYPEVERDHAYIDRNAPVGPDAADLAFLEGPEKLDLKQRSSLGDLVKEDRAPVRFFPKPGAFTVGAGKRALRMPKELRLDQLDRDRTAVYRHERRVRTRASLVNGPGDHLFSSTRCSADQHREIGWSDTTDKL